MKKILPILCLLLSFQAHATLSSFFETSSLGYTPLNQAGDTALGTFGIAPSSDVLACYVKAHSGQTANLQEWQNSGGTALSKIDATGNATLVSATLSNATASTAMVFDSGKKVISSSTTAVELGYVSGVTSAIQTQLNAITLGGVPSNAAFQRACIITSAAGATPVHCLAAADVPSGKKAYLTGFLAKVNGATAWATVADCFIQDTAGSPVNFVDMPVATLTANAVVGSWTSSVILGSAYALGTGGTSAKGLDVVCDTTGTGSNLVVTVSGIIK